jgi:hypothetical protein
VGHPTDWDHGAETMDVMPGRPISLLPGRASFAAPRVGAVESMTKV